jgi:hypothetical protein
LCETQKIAIFCKTSRQVAKSAKNAKIEKTVVLQPQYEQVAQL